MTILFSSLSGIMCERANRCKLKNQFEKVFLINKLNQLKILLMKEAAPMKNIILICTLFINLSFLTIAQKKGDVIAVLKNNEVIIKLHKLIEFGGAKEGNKFLIAEITIENISDKNINMGAKYTMSIELKDSKGNEYRSGLRGAGIVSSYLTENPNVKQDQKAYKLSFSDNFPAKTKARSFLCGYEVPKYAQIVSFGVKKKNLWSEIK